MRIAKGIVGWLCLLSLMAAMAIQGAWIYSTASPFFKGAKVHRLPSFNFANISREVGTGGLQRSDSELLKSYVTTEVQPLRTYDRWSAFAEIYMEMVDGNRWKGNAWVLWESTGYTNAVASALLDASGRVVAAYPDELIGREFPISSPAIEYIGSLKHADTDDRWVSMERWDYRWQDTFLSAVRQYAPNAGQTFVSLVQDEQGRSIGFLAVSSNGDRMVIDRPPDSLAPEWVQSLGRVGDGRSPVTALIWTASFLVLFSLLLPVWVAMDAAWRGMRPFAWGTLVLLTSFIGLLAYLIARLPAPGKCPNCGDVVLAKYKRCPSCGVSLLARCPKCRARMKPGWQYCPACTEAPSPPVEVVQEEPTAEKALPPTSDYSSISVSLVDAESGLPVRAAQVYVKGPSSLDGLTNARGVFEARRLRSGDYCVTVAKEGYEPAEVRVEVDGSSPESIDLRLKPLPGRIIGRVIERGTQCPISGASVCVDSARVDASTITGPDGMFTLPDLPAGPYTLCAVGEGFSSQTRLAEVGPGCQSVVDFALEPAMVDAEAGQGLGEEYANDKR